ncbi:MAG: hypothetical protein ACFN9G_03475 [Cardiobacterium sp.]
MSIFFWLAATAYITTMFSAPISKNYSWDATASGELKEKIFAIVAIVSMFLGFVFTIVTGILVGQQHYIEVFMLMHFGLLALIILFL